MKKKAFYALFNAQPWSEPPFEVEIGFGENDIHIISDCQHIPDAINKIEEYFKTNSIEITENFTLLYPIFLEAMDTKFENTMHTIAWLILEQAEKKKWLYDRIGGLTNKTKENFI